MITPLISFFGFIFLFICIFITMDLSNVLFKVQWLEIKREIKARRGVVDLYAQAISEQLDPTTISILNHLWMLNGEIIPIESFAAMDTNDLVAQELYYHYTSNLFEHLEQLHDSTILQLFFLLPYEIEEEHYLEYDLFNRAARM